MGTQSASRLHELGHVRVAEMVHAEPAGAEHETAENPAQVVCSGARLVAKAEGLLYEQLPSDPDIGTTGVFGESPEAKEGD